MFRRRDKTFHHQIWNTRVYMACLWCTLSFVINPYISLILSMILRWEEVFFKMTLNNNSIDQGWAWVVLIAAFVNNFISFSITRNVAIYNKTFLEYFEETRGLTSLVTAIPALSSGAASIYSIYMGVPTQILLSNEIQSLKTLTPWQLYFAYYKKKAGNTQSVI